jgi:UDP-N-acetylglucosamine 2-epimerase (non-hydrolysing)
MKVAVVLGTRPEAIKLASVIEDLRRDAKRITCVVVNTGQHRDMAIQALTAFGLRADVGSRDNDGRAIAGKSHIAALL